MRPLMPADLDCATRSLLALPEGRWPGKARHLIARAERADRRRRELGRIDPVVGNGTLMGFTVFELAHEGGWYQESALFLLAPSAFFIIGFLVWVIRAWKPEQREPVEFRPLPLPDEEQR